jgi:hypothetical protein
MPPERQLHHDKEAYETSWVLNLPRFESVWAPADGQRRPCFENWWTGSVTLRAEVVCKTS